MTRLLKKDIFTIFTLQEFFIPNKVVTFEKTPNDIQKDHLIIQVYNVKDKYLILI